jgi:hypothetical protein
LSALMWRVLLEVLTADTDYRTEYIRFVQGMSYGSSGVPTYEEAMTKLKMLTDHLL